MDTPPPLPPVKPFVPVLCHGFSLAAHVLLLGGAALLGRLGSYDATSIQEHALRAQMLIVTAELGEAVTEERGGARKVSGPCDEGTMGPVRKDADHAVAPGERAEARKVEDPAANDVPPGTYDLSLQPGTMMSYSWQHEMGIGWGGTQDAVINRGVRTDAESPTQRREHGEADNAIPGGGPPKTRVCPPSQGDQIVFCRATSRMSKPLAKTH
ncbi:hypothetical protein [Polyangium sp. 15x6]|uniref:hypothetical protein n=1 Tax=Polyangium sp. 15x6 TaxID=3042687 RepID=UPI002499CFFF|nr:hypothetical protein [Polyangium sp. 15x6]MDI3289139.1 hypothetical protein [Polyangium sp. 15x6]